MKSLRIARPKPAAGNTVARNQARPPTAAPIGDWDAEMQRIRGNQATREALEAPAASTGPAEREDRPTVLMEKPPPDAVSAPATDRRRRIRARDRAAHPEEEAIGRERPAEAVPPAPETPGPAAPWSDWSACRRAAEQGVAEAVSTWLEHAGPTGVYVEGAQARGGFVLGPSLPRSSNA